jgi:hypothetical protein
MSSAWRMTPSVTDACRSERLHYRLRPALGDRDLSSRHRGLSKLSTVKQSLC